jgi:hypothetical protein
MLEDGLAAQLGLIYQLGGGLVTGFRIFGRGFFAVLALGAAFTGFLSFDVPVFFVSGLSSNSLIVVDDMQTFPSEKLNQ